MYSSYLDSQHMRTSSLKKRQIEEIGIEASIRVLCDHALNGWVARVLSKKRRWSSTIEWYKLWPWSQDRSWQDSSDRHIEIIFLFVQNPSNSTVAWPLQPSKVSMWYISITSPGAVEPWWLVVSQASVELHYLLCQGRQLLWIHPSGCQGAPCPVEDDQMRENSKLNSIRITSGSLIKFILTQALDQLFSGEGWPSSDSILLWSWFHESHWHLLQSLSE